MFKSTITFSDVFMLVWRWALSGDVENPTTTPLPYIQQFRCVLPVSPSLVSGMNITRDCLGFIFILIIAIVTNRDNLVWVSDG